MGRKKQQKHWAWKIHSTTVFRAWQFIPAICWDGTNVWGVGVVCLRQAFPSCQVLAWVGGEEWRDIPLRKQLCSRGWNWFSKQYLDKPKAHSHYRQCCCTWVFHTVLLSEWLRSTSDHSMHIKRAISTVHVATKPNSWKISTNSCV